MQKRANFNQV